MKVDSLAEKMVRIDGGKLTMKQKKLLLQQIKNEEKKNENPDFDPRKNRLPNGIRPYAVVQTFTGTGTKLR